jgi:hypothetical protein
MHLTQWRKIIERGCGTTLVPVRPSHWIRKAKACGKSATSRPKQSRWFEIFLVSRQSSSLHRRRRHGRKKVHSCKSEGLLRQVSSFDQIRKGSPARRFVSYIFPADRNSASGAHQSFSPQGDYLLFSFCCRHKLIRRHFYEVIFRVSLILELVAIEFDHEKACMQT